MASSVPQNCTTCSNRPDLSLKFRLLVAQLVEHWTSKLMDAGSILTAAGLEATLPKLVGGGGGENPTGNWR